MNDKKEVYKAVRNILINELMLTKEEIRKMVEDHVQSAVDHYVNTTNIDAMVRSALRVAWKDKTLDVGSFPWQGQTVEDFVRKEIAKEYSDQISEKISAVLGQIEIKPKVSKCETCDN